ncbi:hypothetical protein HYW41_02190 [Candidatus Daviesbacteria bacterium]|nr:hypothetical protein [Candidatus Daviesbacteria bacterium]
MATGESGIPFYDLSIQHNINKSAWAAYTLGHPINISVAGAPTYYFLSLIQRVGIPSPIIQAAFLWFVLVCSGFGIYFLTKQVFPEIQKKYLIFSVLFYWFNPISLVNVWNRFLNNFLFFYALLPISLFLFLKGIKTKQYKYAIVISLVSTVFSYAFTSIAFDMILWIVFIYTTFFYSVVSKENNKFFVFKFFILTFVYWSLVNLWWIGQVLSYMGQGSFTLVSSSSFISTDNYYTFYVLSQRLGKLIDLLRFKHSSFFADIELINWVKIYQFPLITFFEFLFTGILLFPIVIKRKHPEVLFLGPLFLLSIFFTKGNNPPFGEIFNQAFISFSFLQVFRNPFEKIGFILPLSAAPLFCMGAFSIIRRLNKRWGNVMFFLILFWLVIIWGGPFWSGLVFTGGPIPTNNYKVGYHIKVPDYYKQAADWLASQSRNFRLTVLPIGGEGITYSWVKGYSGVELSNQLLPVTSVSFSTNIPFYEQVSMNLERLFLTKNEFPKVMDILNSKYLVVRSDIDWKTRNMRNPQVIDNRIEALKPSPYKFNNVRTFDKLSFWEYSDWEDRTIYPAKRIVKASGALKIDDILQLDKEDVLYSNDNKIISQDLVKAEIIHPSYKFELGSKRTHTDFSFTDDLIFPAVKVLPSHRFYSLILLKERIEDLSIRNREELLVRKISLLGKRLIEAEKELERGNLNGMKISLLAYIKNLQEVIPKVPNVGIKINNQSITQEELYIVFNRHVEKISKFKKNFPENETIKVAEETLKHLLIERGISPYFGYQDKQSFPIKGRKVYQFSIDHSGNYELLLDAKSWDKYFRLSWNEPLLIQIDDNIVYTDAVFKNDYVSLGSFNFNKGKHEIAWNTPKEINLVEVPSEFTLNIGHGVAEKTFGINSFDPYSSYILNFNYLIKKGSGIEVTIEQNNDKYKKDKIDPNFFKYAGPDLYNFTDVKQLSEYFLPFSTADSAKLVFKVRPWNNCKEALKYLGNEKCNEEQTKKRFDMPTEVLISNVSLNKILKESPFLVKKNNQDSILTLPNITYTKINNSEYKVKVKDAQNPFILVLSELFDPGWKVYSSSNKEVGEEHFLANTYANGWLINQKGSYDLMIKYEPQEILKKGENTSILTILAGLLFLGGRFLCRNEKK